MSFDGNAPSRRTVDLVVDHGVVVTMDARHAIYYDGSVAIDGGRIAAAGPSSEIAGRYVGRAAIDARGKAILPGLIDTHHHFLQNLLKGAPDDLPFPDRWIEAVSAPCIACAVQDYLAGRDELQRQAARLGCAEALLSGITCILNMEWATPLSVIDEYEQAGIRVVHALTMTDVDEWQRPGMLLPMTEVLALADQLISRCRSSRGGRVTFRYGPACENSASTGLLRQVRELASANGVGIHIHLAESPFGRDNIRRRFGKTGTRYLVDLGFLAPDVLAAHCIYLSDDDIQVIRDTGATVSYNPECHMKLALGVAPVAKMLAAGVPVSLGTDSCAVNDDMNLFEAARIGVFLQRVANMDPAAVSAYAGLEMATIGGARALGVQDEIGSLEAGKKADLVLVSLHRAHMRPVNNIVNTLVYCAGHGDVDTVLVDGEVLVAGGCLQRCDERQVIAEAESFALERFEAAGLVRPPYYTEANQG